MNGSPYPLYQGILQTLTQEALTAPLASDEQPAIIDAHSFQMIEVKRLFDVLDTARTKLGKVVLYQSLAQPLSDAKQIVEKQDALRELEQDTHLSEGIEKFLTHAAKMESAFYQLLFGEFIGLMGTPSGRLQFEGYGYQAYKKGTRFMLELVRQARDLPTPNSPYLRALVDALRECGVSRVCDMMRGPVYLAANHLKTRHDKPWFLPAIKFRPSLFKPFLIFGAFIALWLVVDLTPRVIGGTVFLWPILFSLALPGVLLYVPSVGAFDRDKFIYPLRDEFKSSAEVYGALEALGRLDELLVFQSYARSFGTITTLPQIRATDRHLFVLHGARNPVLAKGNQDYVVNDIVLHQHRITFITGPNSGGKTALCKTIAQIQLLAQIGCYVPAASAEISVADKIYYQAPEVGSLDDAEGRFERELHRTQAIFFAASPKSLVILDELSEGTTHAEKLEISRSILDGFSHIGNSTVLVTHNHELAEHYQKRNMGQYQQMEFDGHRPTFRVVQGISKLSHADRIARKIGFSREDIERYLKQRGYV
ncbi:MAG: MutS-related protein [Gammaproteobacteria bacterium]